MKLSKAQRDLLSALANGGIALRGITEYGVTRYFWQGCAYDKRSPYPATVKALQAQGLIQREGEDWRRFKVVVTPAGRRALEECGE